MAFLRVIGKLILWAFALVLTAAVLIGGALLLFALGEAHRRENALWRLPDAAVNAWMSVVAIITALLLLYVLLRVCLAAFRLLQRSWPLFGSSVEVRLVALAVVALLESKVLYSAIAVPASVLQQLLTELPRIGARSQPPAEGVIVPLDQALMRLQGFIYTVCNEIGRAGIRLIEQLPIADLVIAIALWVLVGQLLSLTSGAPQQAGISRVRLIAFLESLSKPHKHALALAVVFLVGVYFSIAAIVAIPWLQEEKVPANITRDSLQKSLDILIVKPEAFERDFPAKFGDGDPLASLKKSLEASDKIVEKKVPSDVAEQRRAALAAQSRDSIVSNAKQFVENVQTVRVSGLEQWTQLRQDFRTKQDQIVSSAIAAFETEMLSPMSAQERVFFYRSIQRSVQVNVSEMYRDLRDCRRNLADLDRQIERVSRDIGTALMRVATGDDPLLMDRSIERYLVGAMPTIRCASSLNPELQHVAPEPGSGWGPFGVVAYWLLRTKSFALALITGMLGFGILGAAISTFVRQERDKTATVEQTVIGNEIARVVVRGLSAALVVFLAVKGGLAILASGEHEPNAYVLFFTCLVGAVFSEDVWDWARRTFKRTFPTEQQALAGADGRKPEPSAQPDHYKSRRSEPKQDESQTTHSEAKPDDAKTGQIEGKPKQD